MDWSRATDVVLALAGGGALKTLLDALASRRTVEISQSEEAREWAREWRERVVLLEARVAEMEQRERTHAVELATRDARIRELTDENGRLEQQVATLTARVTKLEQDCGGS